LKIAYGFPAYDSTKGLKKLNGFHDEPKAGEPGSQPEKIDRQFIDPLQLFVTIVAGGAGYYFYGLHAAIIAGSAGMLVGALVARLDAMLVGESAGALFGTVTGYVVGNYYIGGSDLKTAFVMCASLCVFMIVGELIGGVSGKADLTSLRLDIYRMSFGLAGLSLGALAGMLVLKSASVEWLRHPLVAFAGGETGLLIGWLAGCAAGRANVKSMSIQYHFVSFSLIGMVAGSAAGFFFMDEFYCLIFVPAVTMVFGAAGWKLGRIKSEK